MWNATDREKTRNEKLGSNLRLGGRQTVKQFWILASSLFFLVMDGVTPSSRGEIQIRGEQMTAADKTLAVKRREKEKGGGGGGSKTRVRWREL